MSSQNNTIERADKIIKAIEKHLDNENCCHCKSLLKEVFE
jgi:hypothetical protein